jgi:hypothetical protein
LAELAPKHAAKAKRVVREKFPEMAGVEPTVSVQRAQRKGAKGAGTLYVLTFKTAVPLEDGPSLPRVVRVTMDPSGEIVKITSSR